MHEILERLREGIIDNDYEILQKKALELYSKTDMTDIDFRELELLIRICNILYNRTDTTPPIDDGVYDLLLEKYKEYDANWQVGSEVLYFESSTTNSKGEKLSNPFIDISSLEPVSPFTYMSDEVINDMENGLFTEDLRLKADYKYIDSLKNPFISADTISKREHNTEHNHPDLVGTLDKCKFVTCKEAEEAGCIDDPNVKILERDFFAKHIAEGIIGTHEELSMVIELKYDGISVEADCTDRVISARTRGDTGIGKASDITPILQGYLFPRVDTDNWKGKPIGIKFEAIIDYERLEIFNNISHGDYKNARTAIVGLFGKSTAPNYRDLITLVPIAVDRDDVPVSNRLEEIEFINKYYKTKNQPLRYAVIHGDYTKCLFMIKQFLLEAERAKEYLDFMYDGIVVSYLDENIRQALGRVNYVNKYSMAVKFNPLEKVTTFRGYTYTVGQDGSVTPMIHYDPIEFLGTIHTKSTGSSYNRFKALSLRIGDTISVKYVNDVMPYVYRMINEHNSTNPNPIEEFPTECPCCGTKLIMSTSGKTIICPNMSCNGRSLARMVNMLSMLNIKGFSDARLDLLKARSLYDLYNTPLDIMVTTLGEAMGNKLRMDLDNLYNSPIVDYEIIGSLGFTNIGRRKWKVILEKYTIDEIANMNHTDLNKLKNINGIGKNIVDTIANEMDIFRQDISLILSFPNLIYTTGSEAKKKVRFTGFRDKELVDKLKSMGYDADDGASVTKDTYVLLIPFEGFSSTKVTKAEKNNIRILTPQEFLLQC